MDDDDFGNTEPETTDPDSEENSVINQFNFSLSIPQDFLNELSDYIKVSKRNAWAVSIRSYGAIVMGALFLYLFSGSRNQSMVMGSAGMPQYHMVEEKLNAVTIPGETLKAPNLPDTPIVPGTFVIVDIYGVIAESDPTFRDKMYRLEVASKEPNLKAVILDINSPGGTVSGSETLREEVLRLKKLGIKVIALYNGVAASGACYMSVDADYIIATRSSIVGSIGVIFSWLNVGGLMDRYGLKMEVIKSGQFKDMGSFARDPSQGEVKLLRDLVFESFDRFVEIVGQGRHLSRDEVIKFADGSVFPPTAALRYKLIDQVSDGGMRDAVLKAMELTKVNSPRVLRPRRPAQGFLELLSSKMSPSSPDVREKIADAIVQTPMLKYEWRPVQ